MLMAERYSLFLVQRKPTVLKGLFLVFFNISNELFACLFEDELLQIAFRW